MNKTFVMGTIWGAAAAVVLGAAASASGYEARNVPDGGSLAGVVTFSGRMPAPPSVAITKDPNVCGKGRRVLPRLLSGNGGGIANTVVVIRGVFAGKAFEDSWKAPVLDQNGCEFSPHVQAAAVGARLSIKNKDTVLHNVHAFLDGKTLFNVAMPLEGQVIRKRLKRPGFVRFQCDAGHVWMSAYVVVCETPYAAVTDAAGRYEITGVPPGEYTVEFWHEGWRVEKTLSDGTIVYSAPFVSTRKVTIAAGETTTLAVDISEPSE